MVRAEKLILFHEKGVRGFRLNGVNWLTGIHWQADELKNRVLSYKNKLGVLKELNWHLQCYIGSQTYPALVRLADSMNIDIVLDHLGGVFQETETIEERIKSLDRLLQTGRVWIKLSGFYKLSEKKKPSSWHIEIVNHLVENYAERMNWGSDWPHPPDHKKEKISKLLQRHFRISILTEYSKLCLNR